MKKEVLLMSACLMGVNCRYDGGGKTLPQLPQLMERYHIIPVCGEVMGGMTTPRIPSERVGDKVMDRAGRDVTEHFRRGAEEVLHLARLYGAEKALLKERRLNASISFSSITCAVPKDSQILTASFTSSSVAKASLQTAVTASPTIAAVFGIRRMILASVFNFSCSQPRLLPAAILIIKVSGFTNGAMSVRTPSKN